MVGMPRTKLSWAHVDSTVTQHSFLLGWAFVFNKGHLWWTADLPKPMSGVTAYTSAVFTGGSTSRRVTRRTLFSACCPPCRDPSVLRANGAECI